jgi:peptidoglycan/LPS O-acetylase OafA/YrhL
MVVRLPIQAEFVAYVCCVCNFIGTFHPAPAFVGNVSAPGNSYRLVIDHLWSLCVEEQFYLFWPAAIFLIRRRKPLMWICVGLIVLCPIARLIVQHDAPAWMPLNRVLYRCTPLRLDAFMFGALLALMLRGPSIQWIHYASA